MMLGGPDDDAKRAATHVARRLRARTALLVLSASCAGACGMLFACMNQPAVPGAATTACAPLDDSGATVTSEGLTMDGHYVVVVLRGTTSRVFYGVASHMVEGAVTGMHVGCAIEIDFDVAGRSEVATFSPGPPQCDVASTLTSGNAGDAIAHVPLTVLVPSPTLDAGGPSDANAGDAGGAVGGDAGAPPMAVPASAFTFFCF